MWDSIRNFLTLAKNNKERKNEDNEDNALLP